MPEFVARQVLNIYAQAREGAANEVTATVESLTGQPARSFATFARDHARLFAPVAEVAGR